MNAPAAPPIREQPLSYAQRLDARGIDQIRRVVIHCTELPDLAMARSFGEQIHYAESGTGNSGHFYIDRDGTIYEYVPVDRIAHHVVGHNRDSIGIELVNQGRYPNWHHSRHQSMTDPYPAEQLDALVALLAHLQARLPNLTIIAGHQDLDRRMIPASDDPSRLVARKLDPGPQFPWAEVLDTVPLARQQSPDP